mgnify:CR=1 FL=1
MRIWPNDLDTNAHVNNGRYLTLMDLGRFDLMTQCGLVSTVLRNRWFPIAGGVMVRFERPLHVFEKITLKSCIVGWDEKWLYFNHDIYTGEKRAARATAHATGLPPNVEPWVPSSRAAATSSRASMAPIGRPPPSALARHRMSGEIA